MNALKRRNGTTGRALLAVADQALFAVAHFALNIVLARSLMPDEYGAFAVSYALIVLCAMLLTSWLVEPLLVHAASLVTAERNGYVRWAVAAHFVVTGFAGIVVFLVGAATGVLLEGPVPKALMITGVVLPAVLFPWVGRRFAYLYQGAAVSLAAGSSYAFVLFVTVGLLHNADIISIASAFAAMALASAVAGFVLVLAGVGRGRLTHRWTSRELVVRHWVFGRWSLAAAAATWIAANVYFFTLPLTHTLEDVAGLRVAVNLLTGISHVVSPLSLFLIPRFAQLFSNGDTAGLRGLVRRAEFAVVAVATVPLLVMLVAPEPVLTLVYGPSYGIWAVVLQLTALVGLGKALLILYQAVVRAAMQPRVALAGNLWGAAATVLIGLPLAAVLGAYGAAVGMVIAFAVAATVMQRRVRKLLFTAQHETPDQRRAPPATSTVGSQVDQPVEDH